MSLSDKLLFGSVGVVLGVFEGHEGRFVVVMVLLFAVVGGME